MSRVVSRRLCGVIVLVLGVAAAVLARRLPAQAGFGLGPAFLPFWTGLVLTGCGIWLIAGPRGDGDVATAGLRGLARAGTGFSVLLLYTLALEPLGYLMSTVGFLTGSMLLLRRTHPVRALSLGIGGALLLVLVFRVWLRVPLPGGLVGW